jgi:hypothetical protein
VFHQGAWRCLYKTWILKGTPLFFSAPRVPTCKGMARERRIVNMSELCVGQKKTYRIQRDAIAEFGNPDGFIRRGAYRFSDTSEIWFPNLRQTAEEFSARGYNGEELNGGEFLIEIAKDERRLERVRNAKQVKRIAFPRNGNRKPYCFAGLYKFHDFDKSTLRITWKRIATKINTGDYPICRI